MKCNLFVPHLGRVPPWTSLTQDLAPALMDLLALSLGPHSHLGLPSGEGMRCFTPSDLFTPHPLQVILLSYFIDGESQAQRV
jgi:hypothetical protein